MSNPLSAIIIDKNNDEQLINIVKDNLGIARVTKIESAKSALDLLDQYKDVDFIFIDYDTIQKNSFPFIKYAKNSGHCQQTNFILLGSTSDKKFLHKAANAGVCAFILKPYDTNKVMEKVKKLLPEERDEDQRINLLSSIEATLRFKGKQITGTIEDISSGGCLISTAVAGRIGIEVYDIVTLRVSFEDEKLGVNAEVIRIEKDESKEQKSIGTALKFTKPSEENALQFAKLWAFILKERENI